MIKSLFRFIFLSILLVAGLPAVVSSNGWALDRPTVKNISAPQFVRMMDHKDFTLINVHIPYEGEIEGTDLLIPFNQIDRHRAKLPRDKHKKIVVYCISGPMGYYAADKLTSMGYTRVIHFEGGMKAWSRSGRPLKTRQK